MTVRSRKEWENKRGEFEGTVKIGRFTVTNHVGGEYSVFLDDKFIGPPFHHTRSYHVDFRDVADAYKMVAVNEERERVNDRLREEFPEIIAESMLNGDADLSPFNIVQNATSVLYQRAWILRERLKLNIFSAVEGRRGLGGLERKEFYRAKKLLDLVEKFIDKTRKEIYEDDTIIL